MSTTTVLFAPSALHDPDKMCTAEHVEGYRCTLAAGHQGQHVASSGHFEDIPTGLDAVVYVWTDSPGVKVGSPLFSPAHLHATATCPSEALEYRCTRDAGHPGLHLASIGTSDHEGYDEIVAVWSVA